MHEKEINKFIGYGVAIIIIYYIVSNFIGYIIWVVHWYGSLEDLPGPPQILT